MSAVEQFLDLEGVPAWELLDDLTAMIRHASDNAPRSKQQALGPSEVGHPCARKLAFGLLQEPRHNAGGDPLPSIVGTAAHKWLERAAKMDNRRLGRVRWLTEQRVKVMTGLTGSCDLYDVDTASVIDWKLPGTSRMAHYKRHGPSETYRRQAHMYGRGFQRYGFPVKQVGICFLPRAGQLRGAHLWTEPYDDALVDDTLDRIHNTLVVAHDLQIDQHPERYALIPTAPDDDCTFCPWWSPNPKTPTQCAGKS